MMSFFLCEVAEQLADARIGAAARGGLVKTAGFHFHGFGGLLDSLQPERAHQPDGFPIDKPSHVLPPDMRDMITEAAPVKFQQAMTMAVLLAAHGTEFFRLF